MIESFFKSSDYFILQIISEVSWHGRLE